MCQTRARTIASWSPMISDSANSSCAHASSRSSVSGPDVAIRPWSRTNASVAAVGLVAPVDRDGEADEQARAQRAVGRVDGGERLLEHRDEPVVDDAGGEAEAAEAQRRAAEEVGVAEAAGELEGLEQARAGGVLAGVHLRLAAREDELAAALLVGLARQVERPERGVEEVGGLLVGERAQRLVARPFGVVEGAALVARRRGLDEVVGELEEPGAARAGPGALERLADRAVQPRAADRAQVVVERLADEAVGEAEAAGLARRLVEQVQGERLVEALEQLGSRDAGGALERCDAEAAAGDGGDLERLARRRA
jgi:cell pole-organizing protein PopZ